jgi:hypothetical protein
VQLRGALEELARDPRVAAFKVKRILELLDAAVAQLAQQHSDILAMQAAGALRVEAIASELADAILRMHYVKDVRNVACLKALAECDLERFQQERHS